MHFYKTLFICLLIISCKDISKKEMVTLEPKKKIIQKVEKKTKKDFVLDDKNAIPFLFEYGNNNKENKGKN
jgi:hypothetical protein